MIAVLRDLAKMKDILKKERRSPGGWWKNHILPQYNEERANMIFRWSFEFVQSNEIQRYKQVGGRNAKGVRLAHGQRYVGIYQLCKSV